MKNVYVVATPIGNLDDITLRALKVLKDVNYIFCENINHSKILLKKHNLINKKLISLNKFNESSRENYIKKILQNEDIAIISDAGTPSISDPGQFILKKLKNSNYNIIPIPGANSIITALSASGEIFNSFTFLGFAPKTEEKLLNKIFEYLNSDLIIFFESPKRIKQTLKILFDNLKDPKIIIARELTKKFEFIKKSNTSFFLEENLKGEIVLIINNKEIDEEVKINYLIKKYEKKFNKKELFSYIDSNFKVKKNILYDIINFK